MQIAYMLSMFLAIMAFLYMGRERPVDPVQDESLALVQQMSAWHKGAIRVCVKTACSTGTVNPSAELPKAIKDGSSVTSAKFKTRYDASAKILVTYLSEGALKPVGPTLGTVSAAFAKEFRGEATSEVGQFDGSTDKVVPNYIPGYALGAVLKVPATIAGSIADGAPVIATRM
jgi:hypothetical protein